MKIFISSCPPFKKSLLLAMTLALGSVVLFQLWVPARWAFHCRFHDWTGLPCPTCGGTRCGQLILGGNLSEAFLQQPLILCTMLLGGTALIYSILAAYLKWPVPRLRLESRAEWSMAAAGAAALIISNWIYLILNLQ